MINFILEKLPFLERILCFNIKQQCMQCSRDCDTQCIDYHAQALTNFYLLRSLLCGVKTSQLVPFKTGKNCRPHCAQNTSIGDKFPTPFRRIGLQEELCRKQNLDMFSSVTRSQKQVIMLPTAINAHHCLSKQMDKPEDYFFIRFTLIKLITCRWSLCIRQFFDYYK